MKGAASAARSTRRLGRGGVLREPRHVRDALCRFARRRSRRCVAFSGCSRASARGRRTATGGWPTSRRSTLLHLGPGLANGLRTSTTRDGQARRSSTSSATTPPITSSTTPRSRATSRAWRARCRAGTARAPVLTTSPPTPWRRSRQPRPAEEGRHLGAARRRLLARYRRRSRGDGRLAAGARRAGLASPPRETRSRVTSSTPSPTSCARASRRPVLLGGRSFRERGLMAASRIAVERPVRACSARPSRVAPNAAPGSRLWSASPTSASSPRCSSTACAISFWWTRGCPSRRSPTRA